MMLREADPMDPTFDRVIATGNDKGGVGKTSITDNCAGQFARSGYRVLIVDLNRQANTLRDFGLKGSDIDDEGKGLAGALMLDYSLVPKKVPRRENLYILPGGRHLASLTFHVNELSRTEGPKANFILRNALKAIVGKFDLIIIDTPPENLALLDLALAAARWLLIPIKSDETSIDGMKRVAENFVTARQINPRLALMGTVLFATNRTATNIHKETYDEVSEAFGGNSPMFTTFIGHSEALAKRARKLGKLVHELEREAAEQPQWWQVLREGGTNRNAIPRTASTVSADYSKLCFEIVNKINEAEKGEQ